MGSVQPESKTEPRRMKQWRTVWRSLRRFQSCTYRIVRASGESIRYHMIPLYLWMSPGPSSGHHVYLPSPPKKIIPTALHVCVQDMRCTCWGSAGKIQVVWVGKPDVFQDLFERAASSCQDFNDGSRWNSVVWKGLTVYSGLRVNGTTPKMSFI